MLKKCRSKCCDPLKLHKKAIFKYLRPVKSDVAEKFNLDRNELICLNCMRKVSSEDIIEGRNIYLQETSIAKELGSSSVSVISKASEDSTYSSNIKPMRDASTQCGFNKKSVGIQCIFNTDSTPRKVRLRKALHVKSCHIRLLKKRNICLRSKIDSQKIKSRREITRQDVLNYCTEKLPLLSMELLKAQIREKANYSEICKSISLSIYLKSPKAYSYLRKFLRLPSIDSLKRFLDRVSTKPGFSNELFINFANISSKLKENDKIIVLMMDEINLKKHLQFSPKYQYIWGLEDFGEGNRGLQPASSALCFMVRSITGNWRQLLGYVFSSGAVKIHIMKDLLFRCLSKLTDIGMHVVCITTDQACNFSLLFKKLGVSKARPHFQFSTQKIVVIPDVPHLLKSTRNALYSNFIKLPEGIAQWNFIQEAYKNKLGRNFPYIPKITKDHVYLNPFGGKMKVKYASQILSRSMYVALTQMQIEGKLNKSSEATAQFCLKINKLFDILNSSPSQRNRSPFHKELRINSEGWHFISEMVEWIKKWKIFRDIQGQSEVTARFKFKDGWIQAINGIKILLQELNTNCNLNYIFTRRLCQDALENCFGNIRGACGFNNNPTCAIFKSVFQRTAVSSMLNISKLKNCENDDTYNILLPKKVSGNSDTEGTEIKEVKISHEEIKLIKIMVFPSLTVGQNNELNGMRYVCGVLAKKVMKFHKGYLCSECNLNSLINVADSNNTFFILKQFEYLSETEGLTYCSDDFFNYFIACENVFCKEFPKIYFKENIIDIIANKIRSNIKYNFCSSQIEIFTVKKFITLRIYYCIKFYNNFLVFERKAIIRKMKKLRAV